MRLRLALLVLVSCGASKPLPPGLDDATPLAVSGRAEERLSSAELRFGSYIAFSIRQGDDRAFSFAFKTRDDGEWRAMCKSEQAEQLSCTCVGASAQDAVTLEAMSDDDTLRGHVRLHDKSFAVAGKHEPERKRSDRASGYIVAEKKRALAAIDVDGDGVVWLVPGVAGTEQDAVACVAVALLLHR